jgi:hypothetical protein
MALACRSDSGSPLPARVYKKPAVKIHLIVRQESGDKENARMRFETDTEMLLQCLGLDQAKESAGVAVLRVEAKSRAIGANYSPENQPGTPTFRYTGAEISGVIELDGVKKLRSEFSGKVDAPYRIQGGYLTPEEAPHSTLLEENYLPVLGSLLAKAYGPEPFTYCVATNAEDRWRWQAIRGMQTLGESSIGPFLALVLDENLPARRRIEAAGALGQLGKPEATEGLRTAMSKSTHHKDVHFAIAAALARLADTEGIDAVAHYLEDDDAGFRQSAVDALGESKSPCAIEPLVEALDDAHPLVSKRAYEYLKRQTGRDFGSDPSAWKHAIHDFKKTCK